jgi:hypothetical protein
VTESDIRHVDEVMTPISSHDQVDLGSFSPSLYS